MFAGSKQTCRHTEGTSPCPQQGSRLVRRARGRGLTCSLVDQLARCGIMRGEPEESGEPLLTAASIPLLPGPIFCASAPGRVHRECPSSRSSLFKVPAARPGCAWCALLARSPTRTSSYLYADRQPRPEEDTKFSPEFVKRISLDRVPAASLPDRLTPRCPTSNLPAGSASRGRVPVHQAPGRNR